jgi:hypothetical protein
MALWDEDHCFQINEVKLDVEGPAASGGRVKRLRDAVVWFMILIDTV